MSLEYTVKGADGSKTSVDPAAIASQFQAAGLLQNVRVSPDGLSLSGFDPNTGDNVDIDLPGYLKDSYGLEGFKPLEGSVETKGVQPQWRSMIALMGNDDMAKKAYLKSKLGEMGYNEASIVGQGDDFYFFNNGKYHALTNKPGLDLADAAGLAPGFVQSAISGLAGAGGATVGAAFGPAGMVAGGAGAAAGTSKLLSKGSKWLAGKIDPAFAKTMEGLSEEQQDAIASDENTAALIDGTIGALPGAGPLVRQLGRAGANATGIQSVSSLGRAAAKPLELANSLVGMGGPVSRGAQVTGGVAQGVGGVLGIAGDVVKNNPLAQGLATQSIPGVGALEAAGYVARLPEAPGFLISKAGEALRNRSRKFADQVAEEGLRGRAKREALEASARFDGWARPLERMTQPRPSVSRGLEGAADFAEAISKGRLPEDLPARPSDILKNIGEMRFEKKMFDLGQKRVKAKDIYDRERLAEEVSQLRKAGPNTYAQIGKTADSLASTGKVITEGATKGITAAARGASTLGTGLERGGYIARTMGRAAAPYESRALASQGLQYAEEKVPAYAEELSKRWKNRPKPFE